MLAGPPVPGAPFGALPGHSLGTLCRVAVGLVLGVVLGAAAHADTPSDLNLVLGVEVRGTDNVVKAPDDPSSDIIYSPELAARYRIEQGRTLAEADYVFQQRYFQRGNFDDDSVWSGRSRLNFDLIPQRLRWDIAHARTQALEDPRQLDTPTNQREVGNLSTSFDLALLATGRNRADVRGRVDRQSGARPGDDTYSYSGGLDFTRPTSSLQTIGVSLTALSVDYDESDIPGFHRESVFGTLTRRGADLELALNVGYNWLKRSGSDRTGGLATNGSLGWTPTPRQSLTLTISRQLTDRTAAGDGAIFRPPDAPGGVEPNFGGDIFEEIGRTLVYAYTLERTSMSLTVSRFDNDFEDAQRDQTRDRISGSLSRSVTRNLDIDVTAGFSRSDFSDEGREDDQLDARIDARWQLGPQTRLSFGVRYEERTSTGAGAASDFDELSVLVAIRRTLTR
jgi:hypothetical protein